SCFSFFTDTATTEVYTLSLHDALPIFGIVPKVCRVRRPQTKGKVERAVRFVKENFLPGRTFVDLGDLNAQARTWCDEKNRRVHGDRKSTRLNSSHVKISYAVFCLKKKT